MLRCEGLGRLQLD